MEPTSTQLDEAHRRAHAAGRAALPLLLRMAGYQVVVVGDDDEHEAIGLIIDFTYNP